MTDPLAFWQEEASILDWMRPWAKLYSYRFEKPVDIRWFEGATLNASVNCLDRHLPKRGDRPALIWEANDPGEPHRTWTYAELHREVCRLANGLRSLGVRRGDRVTIYLPLIPEAVASMLACARVGAIHSVVFGGFSAESLASRILDCDSRVVITADSFFRGDKRVHLKRNVDDALARCPGVEKVVMVGRKPSDHRWHEARDVRYEDLVATSSEACPPEEMSSEEGLFILYTSGSTGKPKGVYHTTGGYLAYVAHTFREVFQYVDGEVFWCTADIGWITGHSYVTYGPLANGATILIHEGVPNYPDPSRAWRIIEKHGVGVFYTAPTAIRALQREGDHWVRQASRASLRVLGSVGEPINPEAWRWYHDVVGEHRCPIVDTWWQTETGGIMISPIAGQTPLKPGSATKPCPGVAPVLMDPRGEPIEGPGEGALCLARSWPGQMRTVFRDHARFEETYFSQYPGYYFTGDGCRRDEDGYYWITGRIDDVLNVSGHRIGTAEVESALVLHPQVVEAAVVGYPHEIKGQGIYAFVTLQSGAAADAGIAEELRELVKKEIGSFAAPERIQIAPGLPKTRSGKIMRRILRKIAEGAAGELGDTSTLADPSVVDQLVANRVSA